MEGCSGAMDPRKVLVAAQMHQGRGVEELDEDSQKVQTSSYKISKY